MLSEIISGLTKILGPIATLSKDRRELKDSALRAIATALNETYLYYRDLRNANERNMERESQLSKYWSAAAIPMRHFDENLAGICDAKSEYWINPESYSNEQIVSLGIELGNVRDAYRKLLNPLYSSGRL
ncbi:hypothetical protein ACE1ET_14170 [Saccharicrinis sp. FJH62]|uniref:hypothetical protein n=1 Tax=Saccharicrinis sp. FJH62 TaxID=3344657 RepID=UPI0035D40E9C